MGIEKILLGALKSTLKSGKAVGANVKITEVTKLLREHPKAIGEEIGNLLGGKGKKATNIVNALGGFDKAFVEIDKIAQMYPEAVVKVGAKQSKQGFKVAKIAVKNGDKKLFNVAASIDKNGAIKTSFNGNVRNLEMREFVDGNNLRIIASDDIMTASAKGTLKPINLSINLGKNGEIAHAHIQQDLKHLNTKAISYETEKGLLSAQVKDKGFIVDLIADTNATKRAISTEFHGPRKMWDPIAIKILKPLRERFNLAVDFFKYNGYKDYERFLSKSEIEKSISELLKEKAEIATKVKVGLKKKNVTEELINAMEYDRQITSDIHHAKELIKICV